MERVRAHRPDGVRRRREGGDQDGPRSARSPARGGGVGIPETDWQHLNAISLLGPNKWYAAGDERFHPDNILWDGRSSNIIAIIARHDDLQGRWVSGDIVWTSGPDYSDTKDKNRIGQIIGQHTAHMAAQAGDVEEALKRIDEGTALWGGWHCPPPSTRTSRSG